MVRDKVGSDIRLGRMCGPFGNSPLPNLCISPVGVVPKKVPGKFRLSQHLSFPHGGSVNDAIPEAFCRVQYQLFDQAVLLIHDFGPGALMAKLGIESAFRLLPLRPDSVRFMGFRFQGRL